MRESLKRHPLALFFRELVADVLPMRIGMADPQTLSYLADLLLRFAFVSELYRLRDLAGRPLVEVGEFLHEAEAGIGLLSGDWERDIRRHIGDFTLFWTGVFPEALPRLRSPRHKDHLLDYVKEGRKAYYLVSLHDQGPLRKEAPLFRKLSTHFELCATGLYTVRQEWERRAQSTFRRLRDGLL